MPKLSKQKLHLKNLNAQQKETQKNLNSQQKELQKIFKIITEFNRESLPKIFKILTNLVKDTREEEIFQSIREMSDPEKANTLKLFNSMQNPKGKHANKIILPYFKKKLLNLL